LEGLEDGRNIEIPLTQGPLGTSGKMFESETATGEEQQPCNDDMEQEHGSEK
jgi:hypothetical protein